MNMDFRGFDDWVEIFKGGRQVDSHGRPHDGDAIIDRAVANFNKAAHEPPLVVGHPKANAPAFGWVDAIKKTKNNGTSILMAKFKDVVPEFAALAERGLYKKRSASFYPDGRLRHVGFLGAMPPAVKGLADLKFEDDDAYVAFNFNDEEKRMDIKEFFEGLKLWTQATKGPEDEPYPAKPAEGDGKQFSEADLDAARKEAAETARKAAKEEMEAAFAEKEAQAAKEAAQAEISTWCEAMVKDGRIAPAWVDMGIKNFCAHLDGIATFEFAEGKDKQTPTRWFREFVESLPKLIDFSEIAGRDSDVKAGNAADKLDAIARKKMQENPDLDYTVAFSEAQVAHRDLAMEYMAEFQR